MTKYNNTQKQDMADNGTPAQERAQEFGLFIFDASISLIKLRTFVWRKCSDSLFASLIVLATLTKHLGANGAC